MTTTWYILFPDSVGPLSRKVPVALWSKFKKENTFPHAYKLIKIAFELKLVAVNPMNAVLWLTEKNPRRLSKTEEQIEASKTNLLKSSGWLRFESK